MNRPLRLFLLPSAGGSSALFRAWPDALRPRFADAVDPVPVELPGRGARIAERPPTDLAGFVAELHERWTPAPGQPWAVLGHSFGALLAAEWAALAHAEGRGPALVVVSSAAPPWLLSTAAALEFPLDKQWDRVAALGGLPAQLADSAAARRVLGRALGADIAAAARYRPPGPVAVGCPVLSVQGEDDPLVGPDLARAWEASSAGGFEQRVLPGRHFYRDGLDDIIPVVADALAAVIGPSAQVEDVARFYLPRRDGERSLFEIWERGEARGDSVTPSTYSAEYREWMRDTLLDALERNETKKLLSLGSGNAAVEGELVRQGYQVLAVDAMAEAVELARNKGVEAIQADVGSWAPDEEWPVVYLDGLLGHLYDPATHSLPILRRVRSWMNRGTLVASNDSTDNGAASQPAPGVTGFHWLSAEYLRDQSLAAGFTAVRRESFRYERPISGRRERAVIVADA